jgi:invasion protein IalB
MKRILMSRNVLFCTSIFGAIAFLSLCSQAIAQVPKSVAPIEAANPEPAAPVDTEPSSTVAAFGDWILRCQRTGSGVETQRVCEVAQQFRVQDQQNPVAELAIGRMKKADPLRLTVVLPVNVTFASPPSFSVDTGGPEPLDLGWRKCLPLGCFADAPMKNEVLRHWRSQAGTERITWTDAAGKDLALGLSFRGLSQALVALDKEQ